MLIPFTINPNALALSGYDYPKQADIIAGLAKSWLKAGLLFSPIGNDNRACALKAQTEGLPFAIRKEWRTLMAEAEKKSRISHSSLPLGSNGLSMELAAIRKEVRLLFIDRSDIERYGIPAEKPFLRERNAEFEICRLGCNNSADALSRAISRMSGTISKGTDWKAIWITLLAPFAALHSKIVVVDRYAASNDRVTQQDPSRRGKSGLMRLLTRLNESGTEKYINIFSSMSDVRDVTELKQSFRQSVKTLPAGDISEINLYLAPDQLFKREAHDRYIRFGPDTCFVAGTGLEVLEGDAVFRDTHYHFAEPDSKLTGCEARLRQNSETKKDILERGSGLPRILATGSGGASG